MNLYTWIKLLHIISATLLFGTGLGIAFFMLKAHLSGSKEAMRITTQHVVIADWIFTAPAVIIQLSTGLWLTSQLGISYGSAWFISVVSLFIIIGACWLPVVSIQIRIRDIINGKGPVREYRRLMKIWVALGIPAFLSVLILFYLMVFKVGANWIIVAWETG